MRERWLGHVTRMPDGKQFFKQNFLNKTLICVVITINYSRRKYIRNTSDFAAEKTNLTYIGDREC